MKEKATGLVFFPRLRLGHQPQPPGTGGAAPLYPGPDFRRRDHGSPQIAQYQPRLADDKDIARVHFCVPNIATQATEAHRIAAGGALVLADALMAGEIKNGFALVRPPGHHAMRVVHGNRGFCNINNEPIMIEYLRQKYGIRRVAIVDTDVHHGDGTQDIYWHDPDVLFISFHQDGRTLYPGSGFVDEMGGPLALGTTLNIPLPPGTTDEGSSMSWTTWSSLFWRNSSRTWWSIRRGRTTTTAILWPIWPFPPGATPG